MKIHVETKTTEKEKTSELKADVDIPTDEVEKLSMGVGQGLFKQLMTTMGFKDASGLIGMKSDCFTPGADYTDRINNLKRPNPEELRKDTEKHNEDLK